MKNIIIIPTYNERENIKEIIPAIFGVLPEISVLVVDDNSPDGTREEVETLQKTYKGLAILNRAGKEGLSQAYIAGFHKALAEGFEKIIMMDADLSHDPKCLPEMLNQSSRFNVVVGSRYIKGGGTSGWELRRRLLSRYANIYVRSVTGIPVRDVTGGFNCVDVKFLRGVDFKRLARFKGYAFIMALKFFLWKQGATFREIPILFKNRTAGVSKISNHIIFEGVLAPWMLVFGGHL